MPGANTAGAATDSTHEHVREEGATPMKNPRSTAENIRPILQAMERSIESARRRRLNQHDTPAIGTPAAVTHREPAAVVPENGDALRRKARPKRPTSFLAPEYRTGTL